MEARLIRSEATIPKAYACWLVSDTDNLVFATVIYIYRGFNKIKHMFSLSTTPMPYLDSLIVRKFFE